MLPFQALWLTAFSIIVLQATAQDGDPIYEYCRGDGSICSAANKLDDSCRAQGSDASYYKCICEAGWVPTIQACIFCLITLEGAGTDEDESNSSICEDEGVTAAEMPSSIVSQQEARNATMEVPSLTTSTEMGSFAEQSTGSTPVSTTESTDMSFTTASHKPITSTLNGGPSVTLPELSAPTESSVSTRLGLGIGRSVAVACVVLFAMVMY
ncbi:hypothetical protein EDB81DRAFT_674725 [Dactylonectria macrodidyma]|uniref:Uncharacterized protein n=1 Tax=Dactylonectria macrodidyma TaxID=307937 RepID=A0A9P9JIQ9_9HYPO|nr:hypothetical protein EDB81DRAFT_674725 [Dactylonectria macrodidyma]